MAVVIRLQGLRVTAGSQDIRQFFTGLKIPDGGVHIIGGEREEAFIIFASDEDARRAMTRSGGCIKGSPINLLLSSKAEMQNMLEKSTMTVELDQKRILEENARRRDMDDSRMARRSLDPDMGRRLGSRSGHSPSTWNQRASGHDDGFLRLFLKGMPFSVTEKDIFDFFSGLAVEEVVLLKNERGQNNGKGLVRFATREDGNQGLKRNGEYIGSRYVEIYPTTEEDWRRVVGKLQMGTNTDGRFERGERGRSPVWSQRNPQIHGRSRSPLVRSTLSSTKEEFCVLLENLSFAVGKDDIKMLFRKARLQDDQILHLLDADGKRTRSAFVLFSSLQDYCDALNRNRRELLQRPVHIHSVSREKMITLLESQNTNIRPVGNSEGCQERPSSYHDDPYDAEKICLHVQNLPFDVRKVEIMDFFLGFNISEDRVILLRDNQGAGLGEALVVFQSESEAVGALSLNGQRFLGSEVILKCISRSQMQDITGPSIPQEPRLRDERYSVRSMEASFQPGDRDYPDFRMPHGGNTPPINVQDYMRGGGDYDPFGAGPCRPQGRGNGVQGGSGPPPQHFGTPTCIKLLNLPFQIKVEEIYDFCYGYNVIPGSVSLHYDRSGAPKGSATVVFESRQEALTAIDELSGRPIGPRRIQLLLV
ncbi:RNA binding motif protein 12Bb [Sphaeramia orbicularis]|uniref:RRM domain-containing protein n=1 Tax=Sphaeramia orbicularis TaxID=375764 RepID=A0A672YBM5_9TELE|nr:RNA-binding protein 12B [Sphaeramia orbicularis]